MTITTVLNLKGGVGKSTTVRQMAYILSATYGKKVLVCDLDSSGNVSDSFQTEGEDGELVSCRPVLGDMEGIAALITNKEADPHDFIIKTTTSNVDIIPANDTLKKAEVALRLDQRSPQQFRLQRQLKKLGDEYDYVLLDCPPAEDLLVINALVASRHLIIPCMVNQDSMDAVVRTVGLAVEEQDFNPALEIVGVLPTRVSNNKVDKEGLSVLAEMMPVNRFQTYIRQSVDVERSRFSNQSLHEFKKDSNPAIDYDNFVAEYLGYPPVHENVPYCMS